MNECKAAATSGSWRSSTSVERRMMMPRAAATNRWGFLTRPAMRSSKRAAASKPARSAPSATLDRWGSERSQSNSSLSMPITATSSGTRSFACRQAASTSRPRSSLQVRIATGFGSPRQPTRHDRLFAAPREPMATGTRVRKGLVSRIGHLLCEGLLPQISK